MKRDRTQLPTRLDAGGICIQAQDWADWNVARIGFPKGADATPLLVGLAQDLCPCPHWGMVLEGSIHVRYADGAEETVRAGEIYHWPPGHTVWVDEDYEAVEFSPSRAMREVIEHLAAKLGRVGAAPRPHECDLQPRCPMPSAAEPEGEMPCRSSRSM